MPPPSGYQVYPPDGATGVSPATNVLVSFSRPVRLVPFLFGLDHPPQPTRKEQG